jgi:hypothetical protein
MHQDEELRLGNLQTNQAENFFQQKYLELVKDLAHYRTQLVPQMAVQPIELELK